MLLLLCFVVVIIVCMLLLCVFFFLWGGGSMHLLEATRKVITNKPPCRTDFFRRVLVKEKQTNSANESRILCTNQTKKCHSKPAHYTLVQSVSFSSALHPRQVESCLILRQYRTIQICINWNVILEEEKTRSI